MKSIFAAKKNSRLIPKMPRIFQADHGCGRDIYVDRDSGAEVHLDDQTFHRVLSAATLREAFEWTLSFDEVADSSVIYRATESVPEFLAYLIRSRSYENDSFDGIDRPVCYLNIVTADDCSRDELVRRAKVIVQNIERIYRDCTERAYNARGYLYDPASLRGIFVNPPCPACKPMLIYDFSRQTKYLGSTRVTDSPILISSFCDCYEM